jgi:hypothetical protein
MIRRKKTPIMILLAIFMLISGCKNTGGNGNPAKELTIDYATLPHQEYKALQIADAREKFDLLFEAIDRYYQEQGYYPYLLSQLTPDYFEEIPHVLDTVDIFYTRTENGNSYHLHFFIDDLTPNNDCAHSWCGQVAGEEFMCEYFQDDICKNAEP